MRAFFLSPTISDDSLRVAATSVAHALTDQGFKVGFFQPIEQVDEEQRVDEYTKRLNELTVSVSITPLKLSYVREILRSDDSSDLMEELVAIYDEFENKGIDVVIVEGVIPSKKLPQIDTLNASIASAFNASTLFVANPLDDSNEEFLARLEIQANLYGGIEAKNILGLLLNQSGGMNSFDSEGFPCHVVGNISNEVELDSIGSYVDATWLKQQLTIVMDKRISPAAFRNDLVKRASKAGKRIVLPEGDEPRTVQAAIICHEKGIAQCVLLAKRSSVEAVASQYEMELPDDIQIIEPTDDVIAQYVPAMVELRKSRGLTQEDATKQLGDTVVLGTMMLAEDHVDGLVSGAIHTTANTIRPAFQLIKTQPDAGMASSVFFMLLPENVLVYGDCAINPNPTAEQLATIAIQSADSAIAFGIEPKVAMISYSTGTSGVGDDVVKVKEATDIAKARRPDLLIDGPLQYDAAYVQSVAKKKAPNSLVAGQANVFIFPDLNTGNTTYKAVQRSANVISVGPMLQGLNKPVNDLSRGALVDDIVYTIALTAIQAV